MCFFKMAPEKKRVKGERNKEEEEKKEKRKKERERESLSLSFYVKQRELLFSSQRELKSKRPLVPCRTICHVALLRINPHPLQLFGWPFSSFLSLSPPPRSVSGFLPMKIVSLQKPLPLFLFYHRQKGPYITQAILSHGMGTTE